MVYYSTFVCKFSLVSSDMRIAGDVMKVNYSEQMVVMNSGPTIVIQYQTRHDFPMIAKVQTTYV